MEKKKSYGVLIAGAILLILGIVLAVITHNNSYQESVAYGSQLSDVKAQLEEVEASIEAVTGGTADGDLDSLNAQKDELTASKSTLSDQKLSAERPYSYSLVLVFFAILLTAKGLYNAIAGVIPAQKADVKKLAQAGLLAALCYIGFAFFKIDIPVGPEKTAFHLGNVFCVLAALLLGRTCRCHRHDHRRSDHRLCNQCPQDLLIKIVHRSDRRTGCSQDLPSEQRAFRKICDRRNDSCFCLRYGI